MKKYTPGPWKVGGSNKRSIFTDDEHCLMIATAEFALVKDKEANARLIASAPDLLEACKEARKVLHMIEWSADKTLELVEKAIIKAEENGV